MYFKRLEIQGFKSFATRTTFEFTTGISAVIGPNGSGKSNVSDAIRWVLGEQNPRVLRLRRSEDALFAGGAKRPPAGLAEVSLWLDNSEGWLPTPYEEVVVTRRLHRSGDSEYLINRHRVRLRDVVDLFLRGKVGQNSYALMGQGLVDQVLSLKPEERRSLIEEAAEVRHLQLRVEETRSRLIATRDNLEKVDLIVGEIGPRLAGLEKAARRAREHATLTEDLAGALQAWYGARWRETVAAAAAAREAQAREAAALAGAVAAWEALEARQAALREQVAARTRAVRAAEDVLRALRDDERAAAGRITLEEERLGYVRRRAADLRAELADLDRERVELQTQIDEDVRGGPAAGLAAARATLTARQAEVAVAEQEAARARRAVQEADTAERRAAADLRDLEERLARLSREITTAAREAPGLRERQRTLLAKLRGVGQDTLAQHRTATAARTALEGTSTGLDAARAAVESAREEASIVARELAALRDAADAAQRRLTMLGRMREQALGLDPGARAVLDAATDARRPRRPATLGLLGGLLRPAPGMETAVEAALATLTTAVVLPGLDDAHAALDVLAERAAGRATLLPLDALPPPSPAPALAHPGLLGWLADSVETEVRLRPLVAALLGRVALARDLDAALALAARDGVAAAVTSEGIAVREGAITGGSQGDRTLPFALEQELAAAPAEALQAREAVRAGEARVETARAAQRTADARLATLTNAARRAEAEHAQARNRLRSLRDRLAPVRADLQYVRRGLAHAGERVADLTTERDALAARRAERMKALDEARAATARARQAAAPHIGRLDTLTRHMAEARGAITALEREAAARAAQVEGRRAALTRLDERLRARRGELAARENEIAAVEAEGESARAALAALQGRVAGAEAALIPLRAALAALDAQETELEPILRTGRAALTDTERRALVAETETQRRAGDLDRLRGEMLDEGIAFAVPTVPTGGAGTMPGVDAATPAVAGVGSAAPSGLVHASGDAPPPAAVVAPHQIPPTWLGPAVPDAVPVAQSAGSAAVGVEGAVPPTPEAAVPVVETPVGPRPLLDVLAARGPLPEIAALQDRVRALRTKLRNLGTVNPAAPEEYAELLERHGFLAAQAADLREAAAGLEEALRDLVAEIGVRFDATFQKVNEDFGRYFRLFFGGGEARLALIESEHGALPGIEIVARPPGKRLQSLTLLSGGERAMTAVALLFALLESNPAPFCVLDEVDAALDEANVDRLGLALRDLAIRTQFIVITHSRGTIQAADTVYGVSMNGDGVSSVLSLRLSEVSDDQDAALQEVEAGR